MKIPALAGLATTVALVASSLVAGPAQANQGGIPPLKTNSLASVLAADGNAFDTDWSDFDVVDRAVHKVLKEKPGSDVAVLADGNTALTAFIPTDRAFRKLAKSLTGERPATERDAWKAVRAATGWDIDLLETILLYHVDVTDTAFYEGDGTTPVGLSAETILGLFTAGNNAPLTLTMAGSTGVVYASQPSAGVIYLTDADPDASNPKVIATDINKNNKQIAHAINLVLRPANL